MKKSLILKMFNNCLNDEDISIYIGNNVYVKKDGLLREGSLCLNSSKGTLSICLGIAVNTSRKVFMFCDDLFLMNNMDELLHIGVSKCNNIYIIVLSNGTYPDNPKHPTIFNSIKSMTGILFNMGFSLHDYKRHLKNLKNPAKEIKAIWEKAKGPLVIIQEVETDNKYLDFKPTVENDYIDNIKEFIKETDTANV